MLCLWHASATAVINICWSIVENDVMKIKFLSLSSYDVIIRERILYPGTVTIFLFPDCLFTSYLQALIFYIFYIIPGNHNRRK